jgi:hypothetical protein
MRLSVHPDKFSIEIVLSVLARISLKRKIPGYYEYMTTEARENGDFAVDLINGLL